LYTDTSHDISWACVGSLCVVCLYSVCLYVKHTVRVNHFTHVHKVSAFWWKLTLCIVFCVCSSTSWQCVCVCVVGLYSHDKSRPRGGPLCIVCLYVQYYQVAYRHTIFRQMHHVHVWCVFVSFACVCSMYCVCVCAILSSRIETRDMWTDTSCACMVCLCIICMYRVYASCLCVSCVCMCPIFHVSVCATWQVAYTHTKHRPLMICIVCMRRVSLLFVCALCISCLYVEYYKSHTDTRYIGILCPCTV